jgi:hypothetical protein
MYLKLLFMELFLDLTWYAGAMVIVGIHDA